MNNCHRKRHRLLMAGFTVGCELAVSRFLSWSVSYHITTISPGNHRNIIVISSRLSCPVTVIVLARSFTLMASRLEVSAACMAVRNWTIHHLACYHLGWSSFRVFKFVFLRFLFFDSCVYIRTHTDRVERTELPKISGDTTITDDN